MNTSTWLIPAAVMLITPVIMQAVGRRNAVAPLPANGWVELRLPRFFGVMGWISAVIAVVMAAGAISLMISDQPGGGSFILAVCGMFGWMAFMLLRDARNHRLAYNDASFRVTDGAGITRTCSWADVVSGRVHPISKMIHLSTRSGHVLKVNAYLIGSDAFFAELARHTGLPVSDLVKRARYPG